MADNPLDDIDIGSIEANLAASAAHSAKAGKLENHGGHGKFHSQAKKNSRGNIVRSVGGSYKTKDGKSFSITNSGAVKY
jgi:hypothetical protein